MLDWLIDLLIDWLFFFTDMELEKVTLICIRKRRLLYMMNGCTHLNRTNRTESRLFLFLFYNDCSSSIRMKWTAPIPLRGILIRYVYCSRMESVNYTLWISFLPNWRTQVSMIGHHYYTCTGNRWIWYPEAFISGEVMTWRNFVILSTFFGNWHFPRIKLWHASYKSFVICFFYASEWGTFWTHSDCF